MDNFFEEISTSPEQLALIYELELLNNQIDEENIIRIIEEYNNHQIVEHTGVEKSNEHDKLQKEIDPSLMAYEESHVLESENLVTVENNCSNVTEPKLDHNPADCDVIALSKSERQKSWYILEVARQTGKKDKYYTHIKSNIRCKSLVEVYNFIEHGNKKARKQPMTGSENSDMTVIKKRNGSSLIRTVEVTGAASGGNIVEAENLQTNEGGENKRRDTGGKGIPIYDYVLLN